MACTTHRIIPGSAHGVSSEGQQQEAATESGTALWPLRHISRWGPVPVRQSTPPVRRGPAAQVARSPRGSLQKREERNKGLDKSGYIEGPSMSSARTSKWSE